MVDAIGLTKPTPAPAPDPTAAPTGDASLASLPTAAGQPQAADLFTRLLQTATTPPAIRPSAPAAPATVLAAVLPSANKAGTAQPVAAAPDDADGQAKDADEDSGNGDDPQLAALMALLTPATPVIVSAPVVAPAVSPTPIATARPTAGDAAPAVAATISAPAPRSAEARTVAVVKPEAPGEEPASTAQATEAPAAPPTQAPPPAATAETVAPSGDARATRAEAVVRKLTQAGVLAPAGTAAVSHPLAIEASLQPTVAADTPADIRPATRQASLATATEAAPSSSSRTARETPSTTTRAAERRDATAPLRRTSGTAATITRADPLAAPANQVSRPTATDPTSATAAATPASDSQTRQLDLAQDSQWLDSLARDIAGAAQGNGTLHFKLSPPHLGDLTVALANQSDGTSVHLTASTEPARQILTDAQPRLVAEARAQGLRIAQSSVDLGTQTGGGGNPRQPLPFPDHQPFRTSLGVTGDTDPASTSASEERYA